MLSGQGAVNKETVPRCLQDSDEAIQGPSRSDAADHTEGEAQDGHQEVTRGEDEEDGHTRRAVQTQHSGNARVTIGEYRQGGSFAVLLNPNLPTT